MVQGWLDEDKRLWRIFQFVGETLHATDIVFHIQAIEMRKKQKIAKSTNVLRVVQNLIWKDQLSRRFCCHFFWYFSGNMCCLRTKAFTVQDNHHSVLKFRNVAKFKKVAKGWPRSSTIPLMKRVVWAHKELTMFWQHANELDPIESYGDIAKWVFPAVTCVFFKSKYWQYM